MRKSLSFVLLALCVSALLLISGPPVESAERNSSATLVKQLKAKIKSLQKQLANARRPDNGVASFMPMVRVGYPGHLPDADDGDANTEGVQNFGWVPYEYQMGKYEVNLAQYTAFLNAVAATDTYGLYNANMEADKRVAGIRRTGVSGSYRYAVIGGGDRPVTYVSWFDAARFCNWLHHGRPSGLQTALTTEMGAYSLGGATSGVFYARNPGAKCWIPTEDEWYKAAYNHPAAEGGPAGAYHTYPMASDTAPGNLIGGIPNQANMITPNGFYSVTQSEGEVATTNYLTGGGAYSRSPSFYGTFDQGGNVWERNDSILSEELRGLRGGAWNVGPGAMVWNARSGVPPEGEYNDVGFRIAAP